MDGGIFSRKSDQVKLKEFLGLYSLNINQVLQTWNFNRWFVLLGHRLRIVDRALTKKLSESRPSPEWEISSRVYQALIGRRKRTPGSASADVLVVAQHGRFGNMVRQVSLAIASAEKLGIREVIVKSFPQFPRGTWVLDNGVALTHDPLLRSRMIARPKLVLGGDFFVKPRLPVDVSDVDFDLIGSSLADAGRLLDHEALSPHVLVIHLRSGDAFNPNPHPGLGQPPLSFYLRAIELGRPKKVVLVFEDRSNPVIGRLIEHLEDKGLDYSLQSESFETDLSVLLAARTLVTAQGTLTESLLLLSPHLDTWISFSHEPHVYFRRRPIARRVEISDADGEYSRFLLDGNWQNSPEQRDMMLNYPLENLSVREYSDLA